MSSNAGPFSALQALPKYGNNTDAENAAINRGLAASNGGAGGRPNTDLRGFVKTGSLPGDKNGQGLNETRGIQPGRIYLNQQTGKREAVRMPGMSDEDFRQAQADADDINRRSGRQSYINVGGVPQTQPSNKTVLGG